LHNEPNGCGAPVASAAVPFTKKMHMKNNRVKETGKKAHVQTRTEVVASYVC
jgi:uncharacterized protein YjcR